MSDFNSDLIALLNLYNEENRSNTPDFILMNYISDCLFAFNNAINDREAWYGRDKKFPLPELKE